MSTARFSLAGCGTQTAGLGFGGSTTAVSSATEEYDGSAWSAGGNLGTARYKLMGAGIQTQGLAAGGETATAYTTSTELYDGSTWITSSGTMGSVRIERGGCGTMPAALAFGGQAGGNIASAATEEFTGAFLSIKTITTS